MSPVDIDPVTGAPVITNDFVAATPVTPIPASIPSDAIQPVSEAKPLVGIDNRIEEAKAFNAKLAAPKLVESTEVAQVVNKDVELRGILKRYGMDSQQQAKAYSEIKTLYGV